MIDQLQQTYIIYPGSFSPMHGGHMDIISKYASNPNTTVLVICGTATRNNITQQESYIIARDLCSSMNNVVVTKSICASPIQESYRICQETDVPGIYSLAASNKDGDYDRVIRFVDGFKSGKFQTNPGVVVDLVPVDCTPLMYDNGEYISSTKVRDCVAIQDFDTFYQSYPLHIKRLFNIRDVDITRLYNKLRKIITTVPSSINEGGAYGHLSHIYESDDLSFEEIYQLFDNLLGGRIEMVEKLDGMNLTFSINERGVVFARNKGHLSNYGQNALTVGDISTKFKGRGIIEREFVGAATLINDVVMQHIDTIDQMFDNGSRWINMEIIHPNNKITIPYNSPMISFHSFFSVDQRGIVINTDTIGLNDLVNVFAESATNVSIPVNSTQRVNIKRDLEDVNRTVKTFNDKLFDIYNSVGLKSHNTIGDYKTKSVLMNLETMVDVKKLDPSVTQAMVNRIAFGDKTTSITKLLKGVDDDTAAKLKDISNNSVAVYNQSISSLDNFFINVGSEIIKMLEGYVNMGDADVIDELRRSVIDSATNIKNSNDVTKTNKLVAQLKRIGVDGVDDLSPLLNNISPTEGIVFTFKDKTYKLTGGFAVIHQIVFQNKLLQEGL